MADRTTRAPPVDREKTCPFLLRIFLKPGSHHEVDRDFLLPDRLPLLDESQLYAWKDTTLRDICLQILDASPSLRSNPPVKFSLKLVFLDSPRENPSAHDGPARYKTQDIGMVFSRDLARPASSAPGTSLRTLQDVRFVVGDFIDVALISSHMASSGTLSAPVDVRPGFGIRGAARGLASAGTGANAVDGPRWGRPPAPRWGAPGDRRGNGGFEPSRPPDNGRWGHNSSSFADRPNGVGARDGDRSRDTRDMGDGTKWSGAGNRRRRYSRSLSRSPVRRRR